MTDWLGRQIGKYQIKELLGQGGMGAVYKAYQPALERDVAIKLIHVASPPPTFWEKILGDHIKTDPR